MTDEFNENQENEAVEAAIPDFEEERSRPLPYAADPLYKELLQYYQNAEWESCLTTLGKLLQTYPEDPGLLEFQHEIQMRVSLQQLSVESENEEKREKLKKTGINALIAVGVLVVLGLAAFWGYSRYQASVDQARQEREQAALQQKLAGLYENAENYLDALQPDRALELYLQIEADDPNYQDVAAKIERARELIAVDGDYLLGKQLYQEGDLEGALEIFRQVDAKESRYKDTPLLITQIENTLEINRLPIVAEDAYRNNDWAGVVDAYNQILDIDAAADVSSLDVALFTSYLNLVIETASRADVSLEEIDTAYQYYRAGLAIFPQDKEFEAERAELQRVAISLLANEYLIYARELVEGENFSVQAVEQALTLLNRANNIGSGSPIFTSEIEVLQGYLSGMTDFNNRRWDSAITALEKLNRSDSSYGNGMVQYLLFESYLARGETFNNFGEYASARSDLELAEIYALGDGGNLLRRFQVEVQIGYTLRRLTLTKEAAEYYRFSANMVNLRIKLGQDHPEQLQTLLDAEAYYANGDFWNAARLYELALEDLEPIYTFETVTIERGDMIAQVAFQHGSSVKAILSFNERLGDSLIARSDMEIQVPVLVEDQN